jgi:hypothetical protein
MKLPDKNWFVSPEPETILPRVTMHLRDFIYMHAEAVGRARAHMKAKESGND